MDIIEYKRNEKSEEINKMVGEIYKKIIGVCKTCGLPVYSYTSDEKYKYFETRYTCKHRNGYLIKGQFMVSSDIADKIIEESKKKDINVDGYLQQLMQAKENVIKACIKYNIAGEQTEQEIEEIEIYNKSSFTSEVIHLEGWKKKLNMIPNQEIDKMIYEKSDGSVIDRNVNDNLYDLYAYNKPKNEAIYIKAIADYGEIHQLLKCVEEMAEFQKEIVTYINTVPHFDISDIPSNFIDELVDVLITTEQIKRLIINLPNGEFKLKSALKYKMNRLEERLNQPKTL